MRKSQVPRVARKTRVLFMIKTPVFGGAEKHLLQLLAALEESVVVCVGRDVFSERMKIAGNITPVLSHCPLGTDSEGSGTKNPHGDHPGAEVNRLQKKALKACLETSSDATGSSRGGLSFCRATSFVPAPWNSLFTPGKRGRIEARAHPGDLDRLRARLAGPPELGHRMGTKAKRPAISRPLSV